MKDRYSAGSAPIWVNREIFLFVSQNSLCTFDIKTCEIREIGKTCENEFLGYGSYSALNNEIIYEINHWNYLGNNRIEITSRFVILNLIDGSVQDLMP